MTATYDLIASNVLSSTASSVVFSSIPSSYRDLVLVVRGAADSNRTFVVRFNGDTNGNYRYVRMQGNGSSASTASNTNVTSLFEQSIDENPNQYIINIMDYSASKWKQIIIRHERPTAATWQLMSRWDNTTAINEISMAPSGGTFNSGSTFYLYGIVS